MREDLYNVVKTYVANAKQDKSFYSLSPETQRYVTKTLEDFEINGMKLPLAQR